ncbi:hypothetical protein H9Q69_005914 [Fusarium xylarioides]|nr:hypothetical protein H9Q69_005914 [Fusarium xylarioides]
MIIWLSDWDTSNDIRKQSANLENLFQLEHGMAWLLHKLLQDELCEPSVNSKASHQRLIHLQTEHLNTAKRLILTRVTALATGYRLGTPAKSFTLHLEAGSHQDFCTELLQRIVHRDVAWCRSYNLRLARGTFIHDERSSSDIPMMILHGEDLEAIDELVNRTSGVLSADFNTGVALDAQALARQTDHIHGSNWIARWRLRLRDGSLELAEEMPPEQNYDRLDDLFEFQTDDGQPVTNLQST